MTRLRRQHSEIQGQGQEVGLWACALEAEDAPDRAKSGCCSGTHVTHVFCLKHTVFPSTIRLCTLTWPL